MRDVIPDSKMALCVDGRLSQPPEDVLITSAFTQELNQQLWLAALRYGHDSAALLADRNARSR